jgi:hypothetical protein
MSNFIGRLKNIIFRITHPAFWLQNEPTCWEHDAWLWQKMRDGAVVKYRGSYTCELDGVPMWVSNWPYAYGSLHVDGAPLPAPLTRVALRRYIVKQFLDHAEASI